MDVSSRVWRAATGVAVAAVMVMAVTGCGSGDGESSDGPSTRVVEVSMTEMAFTPTSIEVRTGDTLTFRFRNDGSVLHEAVIGTADEQAEHAAEMATEREASGNEVGSEAVHEGDHGAGHDDPHAGHAPAGVAALRLEPGASGELVYSFDMPGEYVVACHEPGHYESGMSATIIVT